MEYIQRTDSTEHYNSPQVNLIVPLTIAPQTIETTKPEDVNDFKMPEKLKSNRALKLLIEN